MKSCLRTQLRSHTEYGGYPARLRPKKQSTVFLTYDGPGAASGKCGVGEPPFLDRGNSVPGTDPRKGSA